MLKAVFLKILKKKEIIKFTRIILKYVGLASSTNPGG